MSVRERLGRLTDPVPARHRPRHLRNGALVLVLCALAMVSAVRGDLPLIGSRPEPVRAEFASATQVDDHTPVRVRGVTVGRVREVIASDRPRRSSVVEMTVEDDEVVLREDARATVRWRTILGGEMYIDLEPGSPSAAPLGDATIPASRTSNQVELDQVLQPYDGGTEQAQRDVFKGLADTFEDPDAAGRAIETLPALRTVQRGLPPLRGRQSDDLRRLVGATGRTLRALGEDPARLRALLAGANGTLAATNARRAELGDLLDLSPATLDETTSTMRRLRTTLDRLDPLVEDLRPGVREVRGASAQAVPALREIEGFLAQARPLLRDARPTLRRLGRAGDSGVRLLADLDPAVARLDDEVLPFLARRDDETRLRTFEAIGPFFAALGMSGAEYDDEGHRFRLTVPAGSNSVIGAAQLELTRSCRAAVARSREKDCGALAEVLAHGWFGRPRR